MNCTTMNCTTICENCFNVISNSLEYTLCCKKCKYPIKSNRDIEKTNDTLRIDIEKTLLEHTQHLISPTRHINEISFNIKEIHKQINRLQMEIRDLEQDKIAYEKRLCNKDNKIYIVPCPYSNCRGYVDDSYKCCLCTGFACKSCKKEMHMGDCEHKEVLYKEHMVYDTFIPMFNDTYLMNSKDPDIKNRVEHIVNLCEIVYPCLYEENSSTYQDIRIEYLSNNLSDTEFNNKINSRYKRIKQKLEYKSIVTFYIYTVLMFGVDEFLVKEHELRTKVNNLIHELNKSSKSSKSMFSFIS